MIPTSRTHYAVDEMGEVMFALEDDGRGLDRVVDML
jgi:hypothetical protein